MIAILPDTALMVSGSCPASDAIREPCCTSESECLPLYTVPLPCPRRSCLHAGIEAALRQLHIGGAATRPADNRPLSLLLPMPPAVLSVAAVPVPVMPHCRASLRRAACRPAKPIVAGARASPHNPRSFVARAVTTCRVLPVSYRKVSLVPESRSVESFRRYCRRGVSLVCLFSLHGCRKKREVA